jgi:hypothetical protein
MADEAVIRSLRERLFVDPETQVFALLDGASVKGLLKRLYADEPDYVCLWRGELAPDMAEVAPYVVELDPEAEFTEWVLDQGWGNHWGVFAATYGRLRDLRQHFRRFTMVRDPDGKYLYFRFYDPRVLRVFLPTCAAEELEDFFGPMLFYALEDEDDSQMLRFWNKAGTLQRDEIRLGEA